MGFVDERPFRSGEQPGRALLAELMAVFVNQTQVQQLADDAGISRAEIAWNFRMADVWPELLRKAASRQLLRALLERVAAHPEGGAIELVGELLAEPPPAAASNGCHDPFTPYLLGGTRMPRPFLDRRDLRKLLRQFTRPDAERVLVVTGNRRAGRSYSYHLIQHIAQCVLGVRPDLVDLTQWAGPPLGPHEVMTRIVDAIALSDRPEPESLAQPDAQAWKLRVWFLGQVRRREVPCWLVLDGLDRAPLTDAGRRLIEDIVEAVKNNEAGLLRIILLAGREPAPDDFLVLHDPVGPIPLAELRAFFEACAMSGGETLTDDAFDQLLTELFGRSARPGLVYLGEIGPPVARLAHRVFFNGARHG